MIHMELGPSTIVGIGLALIGLVLYFVKTKKPDLSRDYDLFFSSVGLLCGGILIFQGWRLDPLLLLCQILSSATAIFFIGESLWLRSTKFDKKNKVLLQSFPRLGSTKNRQHLRTIPGIRYSDEEFFSQYPLEDRVFSFHSDRENFQENPEKLIAPFQLHETEDVIKENHLYFLNIKNQTYKKKKILVDVNLKTTNFEYADAIDYCQTF